MLNRWPSLWGQWLVESMDMEPTDKDRDSSITWEECEASEAGDVYTWLMHTRKCNGEQECS